MWVILGLDYLGCGLPRCGLFWEWITRVWVTRVWVIWGWIIRVWVIRVWSAAGVLGLEVWVMGGVRYLAVGYLPVGYPG